MSLPFLAGSSSSSASSHLSYLIPPRPPPPPPPPSLVMAQGFSCGVAAQAAGIGYGGSGGVGGVVVPAGGVGGVEAVAVRQGGRHAGHPPLPRPPPRQCPRCRSGNTKFCYYNNYSRKQPRYFCRACRRHWTEGGTLRDVPVGGGRKNRRGAGAAKASTTAAAAASAAATAAAQGSSGGGAGAVGAFPDMLRQMLFQAPASCAAVGGAGYSIDMSAWQQMVAATAPQGAGDVGGTAAGGTAAADTNCGGVQYWSGWQPQDDMPSFDGTF